MTDHRWSGWPGAWCLDCGVEDQREVCLAGACGVDHVFSVGPYADENGDPLCNAVNPELCRQGPCLEPGSGRYDPYRRLA